MSKKNDTIDNEIIDYIIIDDKSIYNLEAKVKAMLRQGWQPHGGILPIINYEKQEQYHQVLIKKNGESVEMDGTALKLIASSKNRLNEIVNNAVKKATTETKKQMSMKQTKKQQELQKQHEKELDELRKKINEIDLNVQTNIENVNESVTELVSLIKEVQTKPDDEGLLKKLFGKISK